MRPAPLERGAARDTRRRMAAAIWQRGRHFVMLDHEHQGLRNAGSTARGY